MIWWIRQLSLLRKAAWARETPRQLALGLACGLLLGLIPKGNLLAFVIASGLFALRISIPVSMLTAVVISLLAPLCDPVTHRLGQAVLTSPDLLPLWQWLYRQPLVAWTSLNNTIVMGGLLLGTGLFYPAYRLSLPWFTRYRNWVMSKEDSPVEDTDNNTSSDEENAATRETLPCRQAASSREIPAHVIPRRVQPKLRRCA